MRSSRFAFLTLPILLLCSSVFGQTPTPDAAADKEKEKKKTEIEERVVAMLDQAIAEAELLRIAQNRAIVYAIAGDLYWKFDEKRARELFRNSAAEIVIQNQETERERRDSQDPYIDLYNFADPRMEILPLIAGRDAELALELLVQTRSAKLTEALARAAAPNAKTTTMMEWNPDSERARQETALEQRFALLSADENPEKAIKLIKESLAKGVSPSVYALLQKLNKKDAKKAASLADDVVKKLLDSDLDKKADDMQAALYFLQGAFKPTPAKDPKEKQFAFSESQIKEIAAKVATTLLDGPRSLTIAMMLNRALPMLERFLPAKAAQLRQRLAEFEATMPPEYKRIQEQQKLWDANSTPEDILAHLPKLTNEYEKASAYSQLTSKIAEVEDEARARKLIEQIPDEKARVNAMEQFESSRISRAGAAGKLDDARKMIGNLTKKKVQIQRLVSLALDFHKKGGEKEIETAKGLMKDAGALTNPSAETNEEINDLMEVVRGYAVVEPVSAFRLFDPVIDQLNDYIQASAVLSKFNPQGFSFKKGELVMKMKGEQWDMPLFRYVPQMQALGKADLDRMSAAADKLTRSDARILVRLYVLQGFLADPKKQETTVPPASFNYFY